MKTHRPLAGRSLSPEMIRAMPQSWLKDMRALGALPRLAGGADAADVLYGGITQDGNGNLTVQDYVTAPTLFTANIREATTVNEDYWIEEIYNTPGVTVGSGVIRYQVADSAALYLAPGQRIRPRAPGAEAPRVGVDMPSLELAYSESWSASLEIPDEARTHNDRIVLDNELTRISNSFALIMQTRGEEALDDFITDQALIIDDPVGSNWAAAPNRNVTNSSAALPEMEFANVRLAFRNDKGGVLPDTVLLSASDEVQLIRIYGVDYAQILAAFGLRARTSIRLTAGERIYLKSGQVGTLAFEKPLGDPVYDRENFRWTDIFSWEMKPIFVVNGAYALKKVTYTP